MKCPFCGNDNTRVVDSRPVDDNTAIRRRRMCDTCGKRFQTSAQYNRNKLEEGVIRACHKRPVSAQQIKDLVDSVETEIYNKGEREIPTTEIGEMVMNRIKTLDAVAYVRFASVYREFKDVETFMDEIRKMM